MKRIFFALLSIGLFTFTLYAQNKLPFNSSELAQIKKLKAKVEANPASLEAHNAFISAFRIHNKMDDLALEAQYNIWTKQFPKIYTVPFAIGEAYANQENPKATPFLSQACALKPDKAEVWSMLATIALLKNNIEGRQAYLKKAMQFDPANADYAFYYAGTFEDTDPTRYDSLSLEVARKFPNSERSSQALYWLAAKSTLPAEKIAYYKQIYNRKSDQLSDWYLSGMLAYFDFLLKTNPEQAFELGLTMVIEGKINRNLWKDRLKVADAFLRVRKLLAENNPKEALSLLNTVNLLDPMFGSFTIDAEEYLALYKAEVADAAAQTQFAYNSLVLLYSKEPTEGLRSPLFKYGNKLGMDSNSVVKSIWKIRDSSAKQATNFSLENYLSAGKTALSDFKGKIILVTYWFPGCGPCRGEFPHFESVLKRFNKNEVIYLGLNLEPSQNEAVLPFLKQTGFSFTPLHDDRGRQKGNLTADGAPTNYLIDQKGRIVFSGFRIDAENERTLELMIKELLAVKD